MRTLCRFGAGFTVVLATLVLLPPLKIPLEYTITAVSSLSMANLLIQFVPIYCRCPVHERFYKVRWGHAGKRIRCRHCAGQLIQVPRPSFFQVVKQLCQRVILRKPPRQIAFACLPIK